MVKLKKGTKRQPLARKYNIQKMVSAHKKKMKRLIKKGAKGNNLHIEIAVYNLSNFSNTMSKTNTNVGQKRKIPEIPNCIFKKDILENLKRTKEIEKRQREAKSQS